MWKLLEPRSTAASTSGTARWLVRGAERRAERFLESASAGGTLRVASGCCEGRAAPTGGGCVRIADHELRALETFAVVDLRTGEVLHAHGVDDELHALVLDAGVAVLDLLIELEAVLQPRAAAALHVHPQHELRVALATDEVPDLAGRRVGELKGRCLLQGLGCAHSATVQSLEAARCRVKAADPASVTHYRFRCRRGRYGPAFP